MQQSLLFDQVGGDGAQVRRDGEAERPGGLEIDRFRDAITFADDTGTPCGLLAVDCALSS
jgi:hypothetical protein